MSKKMQQEYLEMFDTILFYLWDMTTGMATGQREGFKGATRYSRFLLYELNRRTKLTENGEHAAVRRGKVIPDSLINAWAWNVLEDCRNLKVPPPRALLGVLYHQLGCSHLSDRRRTTYEDVKRRARKMLGAGQSLRSVAKNYDVHPTTVMRWTKDHFDDPNGEKYRALRKLTQVDRFYPPPRMVRDKVAPKQATLRK